MGTIQALSDGGFTIVKDKQSGSGTVTITVGSSTHMLEGQMQIEPKMTATKSMKASQK